MGIYNSRQKNKKSETFQLSRIVYERTNFFRRFFLFNFDVSNFFNFKIVFPWKVICFQVLNKNNFNSWTIKAAQSLYNVSFWNVNVLVHKKKITIQKEWVLKAVSIPLDRSPHTSCISLKFIWYNICICIYMRSCVCVCVCVHR